MQRWNRVVVLLVVLAVAAAVAALWLRVRRNGPAGAGISEPATPAAYVGSTACRACHATVFSAWESSHHRLAMQPAGPGTVLGDFTGATFTYGRVTSMFVRSGDKYVVRTDAADGTLREFDVKYTFGVTPLQQYLVELPGGHVQALSIAWDSRPGSEGGQRWFHLYPGDGIDHTDELHWTGRQQNWNFMCADCHSTNLRKGYDAAGDRFVTTWSEMSVGCEACHGPGSRHVEWASGGQPGRRSAKREGGEARGPEGQGGRGPEREDLGLTVRLNERRGVTWSIDPRTFVPSRSVPRTTSLEIEVCARCHSRREQIAEGYTPGLPLEDYYAPSPMTPGLYYADGQQRDEVYTHASFLQSRMAHAGVTCADCHDPHSGRPRAAGNLLCASCHAPVKYDAPAHHFHPVSSTGAACVACHMPERTYMVVDGRRDHSIRVPRPDRSTTLGAPNACTGCHTQRTAVWAAGQIRSRTGRSPAGFQSFADSFHAAESGDPSAAAALVNVADDRSQPIVVRASALARLAALPGRAALDAASRHIGDADPTVRRGALAIFDAMPFDVRAIARPLLRDPLRSVRIQAAWVLAPLAASFGGAPDAQAFERAADEFIAARRYRADRPEDRTTLGTFLGYLRRHEEAMNEYRAAIRLAPRYTPAFVNLADMQREAGREDEAERTLRQALSALPGDPTLHQALGLSLARSGRHAEAVAALRRATELSDAPSFAYTYAVALHSSGKPQEAITTLEGAHRRHPRDRDILFALATFHRDAGRAARALEYAERLAQNYPDDAEARALVESLRRRQPD